MKIAISSGGTSLDAQVDSRFGRCPYFVIVDLNTNTFEAISNPNVTASGGAGVESSRLLADKGIDALAVNNIGPKAMAVLDAAGIKVYTGLGATVRETVDMFREGRLVACTSPTRSAHSGEGV